MDKRILGLGYQVTHITSGSFGMNFQVDLSFLHMVTIMVAFGLEDNDASH